MLNCILKPLAHCLVMGKIMSAAPAAIPVRLNSDDKPYLSGILNDIDKAIKATARTITRTSLKDKVRSEIILQKAGLCCLTATVSESMAIAIWKGRKDMNPLECIFQNKLSSRITRSASSDKLRQPVPGHPENAANRHAQIWNISNLNAAKSLGSARSSARTVFVYSLKLSFY